MHEDVVSGLSADKAKALRIIEPLHCSLFHLLPVSFFEFLLRRVAASEEDDAIAEPTSNADKSNEADTYLTKQTPKGFALRG